jgi:hypothetical protein
VTPSPEYRALQSLKKPARSEPGDMWLCRRLGIVKVFNAHKRGDHPRRRINDFHLYHWGRPSLRSSPCDWRDDDPNASNQDPAGGRCMGTEQWEYIGNIFDLLPYAALTGGKP